jgi:hypothetical protein
MNGIIEEKERSHEDYSEGWKCKGIYTTRFNSGSGTGLKRGTRPDGLCFGCADDMIIFIFICTV